MPRLLLVRHAQSENNVSNARVRAQYPDDPRRARAESERARKPDPELSELGRRQVQRLAERLAPLLRERRTLLVTSPMRRALQTATPLAGRAGLGRERFVCEAELYEVGGSYYGDEVRPSTTAAQIEAEFAVRCHGIPSAGWFAGRAGPERSHEARARVERLIASTEARLAAGEYDTIVIVAHGDLMSRWLRRWQRVPWGRELALIHGNTGITTLTWEPGGGLLLEGLNDQGHLGPDERSGGEPDAWWRYALPDLDIERYVGWAAVPAALAAELSELRRHHLLEREGTSLAAYAESDARSVHFVARAEGELAGYVQYDPGVPAGVGAQAGRLRQLVVGTDYRRSHLGRRLVDAVEQEARHRGQAELGVHAWVDSIGFYAAVGFRALGPLQTGPGLPWQAMTKVLG